MEQIGESHCHDCSHLQQLRQFLRRVTEALLQRQLKRLHLSVVTRLEGSQHRHKGNQGNKYEKIKEQKVL